MRHVEGFMRHVEGFTSHALSFERSVRPARSTFRRGEGANRWQPGRARDLAGLSHGLRSGGRTAIVKPRRSGLFAEVITRRAVSFRARRSWLPGYFRDASERRPHHASMTSGVFLRSSKDDEAARRGRRYPPEVASVEGEEFVGSGFLSGTDVEGVVDGAAGKPQVGHAL